MSTLLAAFAKPIANELNSRIQRRAFPSLDWSDEQRPILDWFAGSDPTAPRSLVVFARAGCGKTTTLMGGVARAPESKGGRAIEAKTLHSLGLGFVFRFWSGIRPEGKDSMGTRALDLARAAAPGAPDEITYLISKLHSKGREIKPLARSGSELIDLAVRFECEPGEEWEEYDWDLDRVCKAAYYAMELATERPKSGEIDFSDMLYLPIRNDWVRPRYDLVLIDEMQDMSPSQVILARRVCKGRLAGFGDEAQAIFGFRGADSRGLSRIAKETGALVLGLKTTYRCAKSIVEKAQAYVPDFLAGPDNLEGTVDDVYTDDILDKVQLGDAVLSRTNAPLISLGLRALRRGLPAVVAGKQDLAMGLKSLIKKLSTGDAARSVPAFLGRLSNWREREITRAMRLPAHMVESKVDAIVDKVECLAALADGVRGVAEIYARLDQLFDAVRAGRAIHFSSVHKAKGLEWAHVYILASTLRSGGEESNIAYVAITRAKSHLTMAG